MPSNIEAFSERQIKELVDLVRHRYPGWDSFGHPPFVADEIEYKQEAAEKLHAVLGRSELEALLDGQDYDEILSRIEQVAKATNLLYVRTPKSSDLALLYHPHLQPELFCRDFFALLYGEEDTPRRLANYVEDIGRRSLPNRWPFPTYFLFLSNPETEFFVKPTAARWFLQLTGQGQLLETLPTAEAYAAIRQNAQTLKSAMQRYDPQTMIDIQSFIWVCHRESQARVGRLTPKAQIELDVPAPIYTTYQPRSSTQILRESDSEGDLMIISQDKYDEFIQLFREFKIDYLSIEQGQEHLRNYKEVRNEAIKNYNLIKDKRNAGEDITDLVLNRLLPYTDHAGNRENNTWIHFAPAISGNIRAWFENSGWVKPEDWPLIAEHIFELIQTCYENPEQLAAACQKFSSSNYSKGFQTGMITPMLNALRPNDFTLINNKSRKVYNYFADTSFGQKLDQYPALNDNAWQLINDLENDLTADELGIVARPSDLWDMFTHWLVAIKKYPFEGVIDYDELDTQISGELILDPSSEFVLEIESAVEKDTEPAYSLSQLSAETGHSKAELTRWVQAVERKGQAVLYGPPGTGKTFLAERLARHLTAESDGFAELVQFHPAYAYEDFIQGIRPQTGDDGRLTYPMKPGRFLDFCQRAANRDGRCVLIIDEINRANLSRVFGELMYLLEYRDRRIPLSGGGYLRIPKNVRLIGTMNTADRSIALVDHALRRRFAFIRLAPNHNILRQYHENTGFNIEGLITVLTRLNNHIADPHYEIGHTFFLHKDLTAELPDIWQMEIEPYLEEYFFDRPAAVDTFRWENIEKEVS